MYIELVYMCACVCLCARLIVREIAPQKFVTKKGSLKGAIHIQI